MTTINHYTVEANTYWHMIKDASKEVKMHLASRILQSLTDEVVNKPKISDREATERFIERFCGSWHGSESAEEIIGNIYSSRRSDARPPVNFD